MALDPKRPAPPISRPDSAKIAPPPASRRPLTSSGTPSTREPASDRGPGFVWLLAPHPGRIRAVPISAGGTLGRAEDATLRLDAPGVAPAHAKVELTLKPSGGVEIYVTDGGSNSGTYVSGMRASRTVLADGDLLRVGSAIALVVERDVGTYDGAVLEEGGIVRGPRSRRGWWAALERAVAEPREGRRAVVIAGPRGCGRRLVARRIGEAWGVTLYSDADGAPVPHEVDLSALRDEDVESSIASAAAKGVVILRGVERSPENRRFALARALEKRRTVPVLAIVDELTWAIPPELDAVLGGHRVDLPSIEHRREEIPSIVRARFEKKGVQGNRLSIELYEALTRAAWPEEIEEIVDCVERIASSHAAEPRLGPEHLVRPLSRRGGRLPPKPSAGDAQSETDRIRQALADAKGSVAAAARALHLSRQALYREAARLGIDIRKARDSEA